MAERSAELRFAFRSIATRSEALRVPVCSGVGHWQVPALFAHIHDAGA